MTDEDPRIARLLLLREHVDDHGHGWIDADDFCEAMGLTRTVET